MSNDLEKKIKAYNNEKDAEYTKSRISGVLAYYEEFYTREVAMRRE